MIADLLHRPPPIVLLPLVASLTVGLPRTAAAQDFEGVALIGTYDPTNRPGLAIQPFGGRFGGRSAASTVEAIVARDLRYSDRFIMLDSILPSRVEPEVDYELWNALGATWLLKGSVEGAEGRGFVLDLELYDIGFAQLHESDTFRLPATDDPDFRMAVHRVSDRVVEWIFNEPGMAASRIAFPWTRDGEAQDIWVVDSDGENLRRLTNLPGRGLTLSPAWHPDGGRILYVSDQVRPWDIFELDLASGRSRRIEIDRSGDLLTPTYSPDGRTMAFGVSEGRNSGLYTYDLERGCCLENLTVGRRKELSPTYSPDGRSIAFNSNRLGAAIPQIYVMRSDGSNQDLVSPYPLVSNGQFAAPEWAPRGEKIAFHGKIGRTGRFHILIADLDVGRSEITQLTTRGNNEDPSWAPDGRHLVFAGERSWGKGLFVVDLLTATERELLRGVDVTTPRWSPTIR